MQPAIILNGQLAAFQFLANNDLACYLAVKRQGAIMWESFISAEWENIPAILGKIATEQDVENGFAVFYILNDNTVLPTCVREIYDDTNEERLPLPCKHSK